MYCNEIQKVITTKVNFKNKLMEELNNIKEEGGNYPRRKNTETQIKLVEQQIRQNELILEMLKLECPRDSTEFEFTCQNKCKWYYDNIIKK